MGGLERKGKLLLVAVVDEQAVLKDVSPDKSLNALY